MNNLKIVITALVVGLTAAKAEAKVSVSNEHNVLEQGQGYMKIAIDSVKYRELFNNKTNSGEGFIDPKKASDKTIYSFSSLAGVLESTIPFELKREILADEGYENWSTIPPNVLNEKVNIVVDVDAAMQTGGNVPDFPLLENDREPRLLKSGQVGAKLSWIKNPCKKVWRDKVKTISRVLSPESKELFSVNEDNLTGSVDVNLNTQGALQLDIHYKMKKNKCTGLYYKVRYKYTRIRANADLDGSDLGVSASLSYKFSEKLFDENLRFTLLNVSASFWVYILQIELSAEVYAEMNISLDAKLSAAFEISQPMTGNINIDWHCTNDGCRKDINDINFDYVKEAKRSFEFETDIVLRPYIKLGVNAAVGFYWDLIDVANVDLGIVASLPVRYFGYYGNRCSDADGDGVNEMVEASMLDVTAEIYMYYRLEFLKYNKTRPVNLSIPNWDEISDKDDVLYSCSHWINDYVGGCEDVSILRKNIYFKDFIAGGSNIFEPVIMSSDKLRIGDNLLSVSARRCYPFKDNMKIELDWGDGLVEEKTIKPGGDLVHHKFTELGPTWVSVKSTGDNAGRDFYSAEVSKEIEITENYTPKNLYYTTALSAWRNQVPYGVKFHWQHSSIGEPAYYRVITRVNPPNSKGQFTINKLSGSATSHYVSINQQPVGTVVTFTISGCEENDLCSPAKILSYTATPSYLDDSLK